MTLSDIKEMRNDDKATAAADLKIQKAKDYKAALKETDERIRFAVRSNFSNVTVGYGYPDKENAALAKKVMKNYKELKPVYDFKGWDHVAREMVGAGESCTRVTVTYSWPVNE